VTLEGDLTIGNTYSVYATAIPRYGSPLYANLGPVVMVNITMLDEQITD